MILDTLSIINFKNIAEGQITLSKQINCFVGDNGAGKTNILDAVHYLALARSMHTITDSQSVRHGEEGFVVDGNFKHDDGRPERVVCGYQRRAGKTLKRNGKEYERLSEHVGSFPIVVVSPSDTALISDSAEERRRYVNRFLSQIDRGYMSQLIRYNSALQERNKLLKTNPSEEMLLIYDAMLSASADAIFKRRTEIVGQLKPLVEEYYAMLSDERESVDIEYRSELQNGSLAEYRLLAEHVGDKPVLLLDDLFDKLDMRRVAQLLRLVSGDMFGQIFITDCNKHRLQHTLSEAGVEYQLFHVNEGSATL